MSETEKSSFYGDSTRSSGQTLYLNFRNTTEFQKKQTSQTGKQVDLFYKMELDYQKFARYSRI